MSRYVTICQDMSRYVTICHDMSRYVTICLSRHVTAKDLDWACANLRELAMIAISWDQRSHLLLFRRKNLWLDPKAIGGGCPCKTNGTIWMRQSHNITQLMIDILIPTWCNWYTRSCCKHGAYGMSMVLMGRTQRLNLFKSFLKT